MYSEAQERIANTKAQYRVGQVSPRPANKRQKVDTLKAIVTGQSLQEATGSLQRSPDGVGAAAAVGPTALIASGNIHGVDVARPQAR